MLRMLPKIIHKQTRIGWIGTGVMGNSMCGHVIASGSYPTQVYNRSVAKTQQLVEKGAKLSPSIKQLAEESDVIISILSFPSDVREVLLGPDGVINHCKQGTLIVDMTTSEPSLAKEIYDQAKLKGCFSLDAPVSGGDIGAREARLSIMVGGDKDVFDAAMPIFQAMGKNITYCGEGGKGQHTKMVNQILIATNIIGVCEGLLYAHKAGLDLETTINAVSAGAAGSWSISNYGPRIVQRNFAPGFFVEHFIKDMGIILSECNRMSLSLPGLSLAHSLYLAVKAQGHGRLGTHSLALALEHLNGITLPIHKK